MTQKFTIHPPVSENERRFCGGLLDQISYCRGFLIDNIKSNLE
jgi:hypothetical protein